MLWSGLKKRLEMLFLLGPYRFSLFLFAYQLVRTSGLRRLTVFLSVDGVLHVDVFTARVVL